MKKTLLFSILLCSAMSFASAGTFIRTHDADTPTIQFETDPVHAKGKIGLPYRIFGVDAPEINQPFGIEARDMTIKMCDKKDVQVTKTGKSYARTVAFVKCDRVDVGKALVASGLAWVEPKYAHKVENKDLYDAQAKAKILKLGLWANPYPIEPWIWRKAAKSPNACFHVASGWFRLVNGKIFSCPLK
jgi:endonuclease YncB( thermonuclease family)